MKKSSIISFQCESWPGVVGSGQPTCFNFAVLLIFLPLGSAECKCMHDDALVEKVSFEFFEDLTLERSLFRSDQCLFADLYS